MKARKLYSANFSNSYISFTSLVIMSVVVFLNRKADLSVRLVMWPASHSLDSFEISIANSDYEKNKRRTTPECEAVNVKQNKNYSDLIHSYLVLMWMVQVASTAQKRDQERGGASP